MVKKSPQTLRHHGADIVDGQELINACVHEGIHAAEVTRQFLAGLRIENGRFMRIEGVADREPYNPEDGFDPRNRRMSIILGWS